MANALNENQERYLDRSAQVSEFILSCGNEVFTAAEIKDKFGYDVLRYLNNWADLGWLQFIEYKEEEKRKIQINGGNHHNNFRATPQGLREFSEWQTSGVPPKIIPESYKTGTRNTDRPVTAHRIAKLFVELPTDHRFSISEMHETFEVNQQSVRPLVAKLVKNGYLEEHKPEAVIQLRPGRLPRRYSVTAKGLDAFQKLLTALPALKQQQLQADWAANSERFSAMGLVDELGLKLAPEYDDDDDIPM